MVNRNHVRCHACGNDLAIRVTVAGGLQRFVFPCPYCSAQLQGSFYAEQPSEGDGPGTPPKPFEIKSEDFELLDFDPSRERPQMLAVAVTTELPVHVSLLSSPVTEQTLTPFIQFVQCTGADEATAELFDRINGLRQLRFELLPAVRRAAAFYAQGNMEKLARELRQIPAVAQSHLADADPWAALGAVLQGFLRVAGSDAGHRAAREELENLVERAVARSKEATLQLIGALNRETLPEHRRRVVDTLVRVLEANDALVPGLCLEAAPDLDLDAFRIQRADFDEVKVRYQDIFELGSRSIVFPASLANIAARGDARDYCDGVRRSLSKALRARAETRETWLDELPAAKALYDDSARKTRNLIGHRLVSYDYEHAALIDDSGGAHNYLLFLGDYLKAARLCAYLLDIVELLTTFERRG